MQAANATKKIQAGKDAAANREADKGYVHLLTDVLSLKDQDKIKNLIKPRRLATNYYKVDTLRFGGVHCPNSKGKKECQKAWESLHEECCQDECDDEERKERKEEGYKPGEINKFTKSASCIATREWVEENRGWSITDWGK